MTVARLAEAVRAGDLREVDLMLRTRPELADMSMSAGDEHRPLHFAVMSRRPEMVRLLMEYGASARKGIHPHREATSAFTIATEREYDEIVAIIEEAEQLRRPVNIVTAEPEPVRDGAKTARTAVAEGDAEWLRARHAEGLLVNEVDFSHGGLLTVAVQHDRAEILKMLLELGFDPNERGRAGEGAEEYFSYAYPLWHAAAAGRLDLIDMLLDYGADPNLHVCASGSPVYSAYSHRQWEAAELLKRRGGEVTPDIAAIYRDTESARRMLAQSDDAKVAEELLTFGAMGGDPEIVRMALERLDWTPDDSRWFTFSSSRCLSGITFRGCTRATRICLAIHTWSASA